MPVPAGCGTGCRRVDVLVAAPVADAGQVWRRAPCRDRSACPGTERSHPVFCRGRDRHHEDRRLQPLGEVEGSCASCSTRPPTTAGAARGCSRHATGWRRRRCLLSGTGRQAGRRPTRWMSKITAAARRSRPGGELGHQRDARAGGRVIDRAPAHDAPMTMPRAAISSSAWTTAKLALPVSGSMRYLRR